jgi:hypothetical protein
MEMTEQEVQYLSETEQMELAAMIVKVLNGVPIIQAVQILEQAKSLSMDTQLVDVKTIRYRLKLTELGISYPE